MDGIPHSYSYLKYNAGNLLINLKINHWQNKKPLFMSSTLLVSMLAPTHKAFCDKQENFATLIKIKLHVIGECFMFNFIIRLILFLLATNQLNGYENRSGWYIHSTMMAG